MCLFAVNCCGFVLVSMSKSWLILTSLFELYFSKLDEAFFIFVMLNDFISPVIRFFNLILPSLYSPIFSNSSSFITNIYLFVLIVSYDTLLLLFPFPADFYCCCWPRSFFDEETGYGLLDKLE